MTATIRERLGRGARFAAGTIAAAATLLTGCLTMAPVASAADVTPETAPSVWDADYDKLPIGNADVTKVNIDNSALPSYLRNPIGQNEGADTPDDLSQYYFSADASTLAYNDKLFVFTGHDEAAPDYGSFNMKDWGVYVTDNPESGKWTHYKTIAKADLFDWANGNGAYAGQVVADDGGTPDDPKDDWFYYYVPIEQKNATGDPFSIGVAKSKSPLGPWEDAIGKPLLTTAETKIQTIDPAFFVDDDGTGYLHFGTFGTQLAIRMAKDATTGRTSYTEVEKNADGTPALHTMKDAETGWNGPKGFFEAAWVFKKDGVYYNVYDGGKPGSGAATCVESNYQACIQYSTSDSPLGPWTYQGVIVPSGTATTMHPSIQKFGDKWYVTYHTGDKAGGTDFRRAVSIDEVHWTADGKMTATAHPTKAEKAAPSTNVAPYAKVSATFTETPAYKGSVNDGRVIFPVVPPDHWTNYRSMPQPQSGDSLIYQWDGAVRVNSSKVWFDVDSNALRAPGSWKIQYLAEDGTWKDVANPSGYGKGTGQDNPNTVTFDAVTTTALKLDMTGQAVEGGYTSVAVAEWEVGSAADAETPAVTTPAGVTTATGTAPALPATVDVKYGSATVKSPVIWRPVDAASYAKAGTFKAYGVVSGVGTGVDAPEANAPQNNVELTVTVQDGYTAPADTTKPTVKVSASANAVNGEWLANAPFIAVQASDDADAPVAKIEISTDQGANWTTVATNANAAVHSIASLSGAVEVWARATDAAGNVSDIAKATAKADAVAPTVTATLDKAARTLTLKADDGTGSGVAKVEYRVGASGDWTEYQDGKAIAAPSAGRTVVYYRATDNAGNVSAIGSETIPSDPSQPLTGYIEQEATATDVDNKAASWTKGIAAVNDGKVIPDITVDNADIWGTWPAKGELKIDYEWDREVTIDSSRVQFTSDGTGGTGLTVPADWKLQYWNGSAFVDIPDAAYTVVDNSPTAGWATGDAKGWSEATWPTPVKTSKLRMVMTASTGSPAIAEWQVHAVAGTPDPGPEPKPVTSVAVSAEGGVTSLDAGASVQLKAAVEPADADDASVTWSSSDDAVASVDAKTGKVTAAADLTKDAKVTITATSVSTPAVKGSIELTVKAKQQPEPSPEPSVDSVAISGDGVADGRLALTEGGSAALVAEVKVTGDAAKTVSWKSSDDAVATVSDKGVVTAVAAGKATITATSTVDASKSASIEVTVTAKEPEPEPEPGDKVTFIDVDEATPHRADIDWLAENKISEGWDNGDGTRSFGPMRTVVRQDMAAFLYRLAGSPEFDESKVVNPFADVDESTPHYREILWLYSTGISRGYVDANGVRTFGGMRTVVRQDMAAFLQRLADVRGASPELGGVVSFPDVTDSTPHADAIEWLARTGVTTGFEDGSFGGMRDVVRQDMAAFLHRMDANVLNKQ